MATLKHQPVGSDSVVSHVFSDDYKQNCLKSVFRERPDQRQQRPIYFFSDLR